MFLGANFMKALNVRIGYENDNTVVLVNQDKWILRNGCCNSFEFKEPKLADQEVYLSELAQVQSDDEFEKEFDIESVPKNRKS
jgi:hypothetical protein